MEGGPSAICGRAEVMEMKEALVDRLGNMDYSFAVSKYLHEELQVNQCVLKCGGGVIELLIAFKSFHM